MEKLKQVVVEVCAWIVVLALLLFIFSMITNI